MNGRGVTCSESMRASSVATCDDRLGTIREGRDAKRILGDSGRSSIVINQLRDRAFRSVSVFALISWLAAAPALAQTAATAGTAAPPPSDRAGDAATADEIVVTG